MSAMKYFGGFNNRNSVAYNFLGSGYHDKEWSPPADFPDEAEILFASYGGSGYDGDAIVIYEREGKIYEVHGAHCSCYGLEGQWWPEETSWEALYMRPRGGYACPMSDHDEAAARAFWSLVESHLAGAHK